jgi:hypothetical protein
MKNEKNRKASISTANMEQAVVDEQMGPEECSGLDTPCRIHVHSRRHRLADADGISAKAAIDGIVRGGLLVDDSAQHVEEVTYSQEKIKRQEIEETIITIWSCDGENKKTFMG